MNRNYEEKNYMNVWMVILLTIVITAVVIYFLTAVLAVRMDKIFGTPLMLAIITILLAGVSYYFVWEKSIYVVIKADESAFYKSAIPVSDDMWKKEELFRYSSETRGVGLIDFSQQVKELLSADKVKLCRDYISNATGTGRYKSEAGVVVVCVNKKGLRWHF